MRYNGCDYLSMLGFKIIHVSKSGHRSLKPTDTCISWRVKSHSHLSTLTWTSAKSAIDSLRTAVQFQQPLIQHAPVLNHPNDASHQYFACDSCQAIFVYFKLAAPSNSLQFMQIGLSEWNMRLIVIYDSRWDLITAKGSVTYFCFQMDSNKSPL